MKQVAEVWGAKSTTTLGVKTPPNEDLFSDKNAKLIRKSALSYHEKFDRPFRPSINQVIQFEMQKAIFTKELGRSISPADYDHYMQLKDKNFNIPTRVNPIKSLIGRMLRGLVSLFIR